MKKLVILAVAAVAVLGSCDVSSVPRSHWRRTDPSTELVVNLVYRLTDPPDVKYAVDRAARDWSAAANVRVRTINVEQRGQVNVSIVADPKLGPGEGSTWLSGYSDGHLAAAAIRVGSTWAPMSVDARVLNATCHEVGHALGLDHAPDGARGPCRDGHPTVWDLFLVGQVYEHTHV